MRGCFLIACLLALLLGCGRQKPASPTAAEATPGGPAAAASEAELAALLSDLTQRVRKFAVEQRRAPKTLKELAAQGYLGSVPVAPAGKRFAINNDLKVYLAER
ncbi:MAG: hypothetical protein HYY24_16655 [Verrucomicrobia bacterium]|nr:hypothetical protein [Verrucomicrobiota bacterium]